MYVMKYDGCLTRWVASAMISSPRIDPVILLDWSTIVLTKLEGLTLKSNSPVGASHTRTADSETSNVDGSCGSDVQLFE